MRMFTITVDADALIVWAVLIVLSGPLRIAREDNAWNDCETSDEEVYETRTQSVYPFQRVTVCLIDDLSGILHTIFK